eukprot:5265603-Pyramimonas_sp.AAC.1
MTWAAWERLGPSFRILGAPGRALLGRCGGSPERPGERYRERPRDVAGRCGTRGQGGGGIF